MADARFIMDTLGVTSYNFVCPDCSTSQDSLAAIIFSQTPEFIDGSTVFKSTQFTLSMKRNFSDIENPE